MVYLAAERTNGGRVEVLPDSTQSPADWKEGSLDRPHLDSLGQMNFLFSFCEPYFGFGMHDLNAMGVLFCGVSQLRKSHAHPSVYDLTM